VLKTPQMAMGHMGHVVRLLCRLFFCSCGFSRGCWIAAPSSVAAASAVAAGLPPLKGQLQKRGAWPLDCRLLFCSRSFSRGCWIAAPKGAATEEGRVVAGLPPLKGQLQKRGAWPPCGATDLW
jgi:hypothetical protein